MLYNYLYSFIIDCIISPLKSHSVLSRSLVLEKSLWNKVVLQMFQK